MDWKLFATIFGTVFLAELGDKTQLATMLYAADREIAKITVFIAAASALILTSAIGVLAGDALAQWVNPRYLTMTAGICFILVGVWTIYQA
jgi:putative Ca2+/H+ antiporter (TMEM165/GDT1 family)